MFNKILKSKKLDKAYQIRLLDDKPENKSHYEWHNRVAQSIYELIQSEAKGRSICLFGSWGSGKSTVIKILEDIAKQKQEKKNTDCYVFTFDAWLHVNDPIRRSIIEELEKFYGENLGLIDIKDKKLREIVDTATGKREEQSEKTSFTSSPFNILVMSAILCSLAAGNSYFKKVFEVKAVDLYTALYSAAYFVIPALIVIILRQTGLFIQKAPTEQKTVTIKTPEATAIEFQKAVNKILEFSRKRKSHKLIIVLDNLDRVSAQEATNILATLRSFFSADKHQHVWVIVPLDSSSFKTTSANNNNPLGLLTQPPPAKDHAQSFIEKAFDVSFYVAPPVITDASKFFRNMLDFAFGDNLDTDTKESIFNLYESENLGDYKHTPRKVKRFINDFIALYKVWKDYLPNNPLTLVLYCLKRDYIQNDLRSFLFNQNANGRVSPKQDYIVNDKNWQQHFSAIFYGVQIKDAYHVMLDSPIETALQNGDESENFINLSKIDGFNFILNEKIQTGLLASNMASDASSLLKAVRSLKALENSGYPHLNRAWQILFRSAHKMERWEEITDKSADSVKLFISTCPDAYLHTNTIKICQALLGISPGKDFRGDLWSNTLLSIATQLDQRNAKDFLIEALESNPKKINADIYYQSLTAAVKNSQTEISDTLARILDINDDLQISSTKMIVDIADLQPLSDSIKFLIEGGVKYRFSQVTREIFTSINKLVPTLDIYNIIIVLGRLARLNDLDALKSIKETCDIGSLYWYIQNYRKKKTQAYYICVAAALVYHQGNRPSSSDPNIQAGAAICEHILKLQTQLSDDETLQIINAMSEITKVETIYEAYFSNSINKQFFGQLIRNSSFRDRFPLPSTQHILDRYAAYKDSPVIEIAEANNLIDVIIDRDDFLTEIIKKSYYQIPTEILERLDGSKLEIEDHIKDGLHSTSTEEWKDVLLRWITRGKKDVRIDILDSYLKKDGSTTPSNFIHALSQILDTIISIQDTKEINDYLDRAVKKSDTSSRELFEVGFFNLIIKYAAKQNSTTLDKLITWCGFYGLPLREIKKNPSQFAESALLPMLSVNLPKCLDWLQRHSAELSPIIRTLPNDLKEQLSEKLNGPLNGKTPLEKKIKLALESLKNAYNLD